MPVATQASVKGLEIAQVRQTGAQMVLANTYHLALRPGEEVVRDLGGLHRFMGWDGPILTDSGGFQLFSLAAISKVTEEGAVFRSHIDGRLLAISPERAVAIQEALGSDVAMVLDHVVALPNRAGGRPRRDATERPLGGPLPPGRHPAGPGPLRHRPGRTGPRSAGLVCGGVAARGFCRLRRGGLERGRAAGGDVPHPRGGRARAAGRPAPLPDGRGAAGGPFASHRTGHRPVRLRDAHPQRPQRPGLYRRRHRCGCGTCNMRGTTGRWKRAVPVRPAAAAAATCGTSSWPTRCWGRCCCRSTT